MNRSPHLSEDQLIELVYGVGDESGHLSGCSECSERLLAMRRVRAEATGDSEISGRMLAMQRQRILDRLQQPSAGLPAWRWIPAAAAATLLAAALVLSRPAAIPLPAPAAVSAESDAALFTDVYSMEQDVEPRAAAPIRSLFQETSFELEKER
jgi:hypothetical protein